MTKQGEFTVGRDVGFVGRWFRLIVGVYFSALAIADPLLADPVIGRDPVAFLGEVAIYFVAILVFYVVAVYLLGERVLARANPWVGTILMLGPLGAITTLELGPLTFRVAIGLYYSLASILNFAMSYGGCEVIALPSLIFRRRYTVYCPYNAVDAIENALNLSSQSQRALAVLSMAIAVVVGGYFLLVEELNMIRSLGVAIDVDNRWALLLLIPIVYLAWNAWRSYQARDGRVRRQARRLALGAGLLLLLTMMFVTGEEAMPLFGLAMLLGGLIALVEWLRRRTRQTQPEVRA